MKHISVRATITAGAILAALTVGTVAIAMPGIEQPVAPTETTTPTPEPTGTGDYATPTDQSERQVLPGLRAKDLKDGWTVSITPTGYSAYYSGVCTDTTSLFTVWSNVPGQWSSQGSACQHKQVGEHTYFGVRVTWDEYTRNAYCYSPLGAMSAYRAEAFGVYSEWIPIPEQYKQCINNQAPEGKIYSSPSPSATPTTTPSSTPSATSTSTPTASPSPTSTP